MRVSPRTMSDQRDVAIFGRVELGLTHSEMLGVHRSPGEVRSVFMGSGHGGVVLAN